MIEENRYDNHFNKIVFVIKSNDTNKNYDVFYNTIYSGSDQAKLDCDSWNEVNKFMDTKNNENVKYYLFDIGVSVVVKEINNLWYYRDAKEHKWVLNNEYISALNTKVFELKVV